MASSYVFFISHESVCSLITGKPKLRLILPRYVWPQSYRNGAYERFNLFRWWSRRARLSNVECARVLVAILGFTLGGSGVAIIAAGGTDLYCHSEPPLTSGKLCFIINFIGGHRGRGRIFTGGRGPPAPCTPLWTAPDGCQTVSVALIKLQGTTVPRSCWNSRCLLYIANWWGSTNIVLILQMADCY